jgi:hypothetical protein
MKYYCSIILLFLSISLTAQNYSFGKVSAEELNEKYNPADSSASATYLYKYRRTYFQYQNDKGFELVTEVHERIKIYNQEGFDYATKEIMLYKSNTSDEEVSSIKACTYNMIDGKIVEDKLRKDGMFREEVSYYYNKLKFTMPNIKVGSVIEYEYSIRSPFITNVDEFVFQHDIPIKQLEAKFEVPEYFSYKLNTKGFVSLIPNVESKRGKIAFMNKTRSGGLISSTSFSSSEVEFTKNISTYTLSNVPALKDEPYVNNINNYRSAVKYELSYTHFPSSTIEYYSTTWEDVIKKIYETPSFGNELDKTGYFEKDIDALIGNISDPMARVSLIFEFVKNKVKWNGYYSKYTSQGVRKAYTDQVGNVVEINLMLTSMLRYAGLNANPFLVSTRNNGLPLFPTREGYNYVISGVEIPNTVILLDATSKYSMPNVLPLRALNWEGRIIRKNGTTATINLYPNEASTSNEMIMVNLNTEGAIDGTIRSLKTNHKALLYREDYIESNKDLFLETLENRYAGIQIEDFEVKNDIDLSKPVMETYKFTLENQADIIGDKMYFSPLFFLKSKESPFKLNKREFPVDFSYPVSSKSMINISLPEGYKVESVPEAIAISLPDNLGVFRFNIVATATGIQLIINNEINQSIISSLYYDALKDYFGQMVAKENEQVVLTKI